MNLISISLSRVLQSHSSSCLVVHIILLTSNSRNLEDFVGKSLVNSDDFNSPISLETVVS